MKLKKLTFTLAVLSMSFALLSGSALAGTTYWASCTPKQIGHQDGFVRVNLKNCNRPDIASADGYMTLSSTGEDQMMATILTAISLNSAVAVGTDRTEVNGYPVATAIYLDNKN